MKSPLKSSVFTALHKDYNVGARCVSLEMEFQNQRTTSEKDLSLVPTSLATDTGGTQRRPSPVDRQGHTIFYRTSQY